MARLQILELPVEHHGDDMVTPFVLVIDGWDIDSLDENAMLDGYWDQFAAKIGARGVLFTNQVVEIPANNPTARGEQSEPHREDDRSRQAEAKLKAAFDLAAQLEAQRDEARQWARHGYEIGQRHCGWTDHGVAPAWLTEGWPPHIDSCEHLKRAAEYDTALGRVLEVADDLEAAEAQGGAWDANQQAARCIRAAVGRSRDEKAGK